MKKYFKYYYKSIKEVYIHSKLLFLLYVLFSLIAGVLTAIPIILLQMIFDSLSSNSDQVIYYVIAFMCIKAFYAIVEGVSFYAFERMGEVVEYKLKRKVMNVELELIDYENKEKLDSLKKSLVDVNTITEFSDSMIYPLFNNIPSLLFVSLYIWNVNPLLVIILLLMFIPSIYNQYIMGIQYKELNNVIKDNDRKIDCYYSYLTNQKYVKETKILKCSYLFSSKLVQCLKIRLDCMMNVNNKDAKNNLISDSFILIGFIVLTVMMFISLMNEAITIGYFAAIYTSMYSMFSKIEVITYLVMKSAVQSVDKVIEYFDFVEQRYSSKYKEVKDIESIRFNEVNFKYPSSKLLSLKDINLDIKDKEFIVIVGENGSGKSTLVKLLLSLYVPTNGEMLYNEQVGTIIESSSALLQDFERYGVSLDENIMFDNKDLKLLDNVKSKARLNIDGNQILSKEFGGVDLSGGLWQKVAMARALYKDSKVIVFDEPTAAIDAKEEYELFNTFKSLKKQKTVIVVTHRMASVTMADRIIVMDKGTIVGQGTHDKLLKECNKYNSLWNAQSIQYN